MLLIKNQMQNHAIICPVNRKKLMEVKSKKKPIVEVYEKGHEEKYNLVTRCPTCKSFVGVILEAN